MLKYRWLNFDLIPSHKIIHGLFNITLLKYVMLPLPAVDVGITFNSPRGAATRIILHTVFSFVSYEHRFCYLPLSSVHVFVHILNCGWVACCSHVLKSAYSDGLLHCGRSVFLPLCSFFRRLLWNISYCSCSQPFYVFPLQDVESNEIVFLIFVASMFSPAIHFSLLQTIFSKEVEYLQNFLNLSHFEGL